MYFESANGMRIWCIIRGEGLSVSLLEDGGRRRKYKNLAPFLVTGRPRYPKNTLLPAVMNKNKAEIELELLLLGQNKVFTARINQS